MGSKWFLRFHDAYKLFDRILFIFFTHRSVMSLTLTDLPVWCSSQFHVVDPVIKPYRLKLFEVVGA